MVDQNSIHPKGKEILEKLRKIPAGTIPSFATQRGFAEWTFRQLVMHKGYKDALERTEGYSKNPRHNDSFLVQSYLSIIEQGFELAPLHPSPESKPIEESNSLFDQQPTNDAPILTRSSFSQTIYDNLPLLLRSGCEILSDDTEKEVFLIGALGVVSGILPNVQGFYDGNYYHSNLYTYILAKYGSGKGSLKYAYELGKAIHLDKKEKYKEALEEYESSSDDSLEAPKRQLLFIPANNSKTGIFELLAENKEQGIIFETEGDTIADTIKQDYGNYSDGLRKAFHHEKIDYYRRGGKELIDIQHPQISLVLSSTFDQLLKLIPSAQNGLYSRFLFYELEPNFEFKNVFDQQKSNYPERFKMLGESCLDIYNALVNLESPVNFDLQQKHKDRFLEVFREWKQGVLDSISEDLNGSINRLGLICFRIAMIFTTLRYFEEYTSLPKEIICNDTDFDNALAIVNVLMDNNILVYDRIQEVQPAHQSSEYKAQLKLRLIEDAVELREKGYSYGQIAETLNIPKSTVARWLKNNV